MPQLEKDYIQTGKVKYVIREYPIESIHKQAFKAAEAARCAGDKGKYWEMHDKIFANQGAMSPKDLVDHAQTLGLDVASFQQCLDSGRYAAKVRKDLGDANLAGVRGTPSFFLGLTEPNDSKITAVRSIRGAESFSGFQAIIDSVLGEQKQ